MWYQGVRASSSFRSYQGGVGPFHGLHLHQQSQEPGCPPEPAQNLPSVDDVKGQGLMKESAQPFVFCLVMLQYFKLI